jgi:hypothetical protein
MVSSSEKLSDQDGRREGGSHPIIQEAPRLRPVLETIGFVIAPTTFLTGLLFYFGRVYTTARLSYFGMDPSVAELSTQEYLLRSVQPMFVPLGVMAVIGLVLVWTHSMLVSWMQAGQHSRILTALPVGLGISGIALVAIGVAGLLGYPLFGIDLLITPVSLTFGTVGLSYAVYLRRRLHGGSSFQPRWASLASMMLVSVLVIVNVFWAMGEWALGLGRGRAQELAAQLAYRAPGVVVYSKQPLSIDPATGVTSERVEGNGSPYKVRYRRLRLFLHSNDRYFLVPTDWSPSTGVVIVLPDSDATRIELTPP